MEKQIEIPGKRKKPKQPSRPNSAQPSLAPARLRRKTGGFHPSAAVPFPALSLSLSLPSGARLSALVAFRRAPALSLAAMWDRPVSSAFPAPAVDQNARTRACTPRSSATSPCHAP